MEPKLETEQESEQVNQETVNQKYERTKGKHPLDHEHDFKMVLVTERRKLHN